MKYLIAILLVCLGYLTYSNSKLRESLERERTTERFRDLGDGVFSSDVVTSTKDEIIEIPEVSVLASKVKEKVNNAHSVDSMSYTARIDGTLEKDISGTITESSSDKVVQATNHLKLLDHGLSGLHIGNVSFSSGSDTPWSYELFPKEISLNALLIEGDDSGKSLVSQLKINVNGKEETVPLSKSILRTSPEENRFRIKPIVTVGAGYSLFGPKRFEYDLGLSFMNFGTRREPDWIFGTVGVGLDSSRNWKVSIDPVSYRISKYLPGTSNIYFGPSLFTDSETYGSSLMLRVKL